MFHKSNICHGVGINYRSDTSKDIINNIDKFDFIEINTERFFMSENQILTKNIIGNIPITLHGLTLSIGTLNQGIPTDYLNNLTATLNKVDCLWFSEHIAVTCVNGVEMRTLSPAEFTDESVDIIVEKIKKIIQLSNKPFLLENITYYYSMPSSNLSEIEFINNIVEKSDCGILLDLNNLWVNSVNHQYDPYEYINQLPLDRIVEVHLAGNDYIQGMLIDTHASSIKKEVIDLFQYLCQKTFINGVIIERDAKLTNFSELIDEVSFVRNILKKHKILAGNIYSCII